MNLEVLAWAPTRQDYMDAMTSTVVPSTGKPLATYQADMISGDLLQPLQLAYHPGLNVAELGEIVDTPAVPNPDNPMGPPLTPAVMVAGHHVDLRFHEPLADELVKDLPQVDEDGVPLILWERTHLLDLFPGAVWHQDETGVPGGYVGVKNMKLFDPNSVKTRSHGWA